MKYDCYPRFLRSPIYRECVQALQHNEAPPISELTLNDPDLNIDYDFGDGDTDSLNRNLALKKSESDAGERRRRSLLPWPKKDRSKSKVCHFGFPGKIHISYGFFFFSCFLFCNSRTEANLITGRRPRKRIDRVVPVVVPIRRRKTLQTMKTTTSSEPHPGIQWLQSSVTGLSTFRTRPVQFRWSKSSFRIYRQPSSLPDRGKVSSNSWANCSIGVVCGSTLSNCTTATVPWQSNWNETLLSSAEWKSDLSQESSSISYYSSRVNRWWSVVSLGGS